MRKKRAKAIRRIANDLPDMYTSVHSRYNSSYKVPINHYRRMKRAYKTYGSTSSGGSDLKAVIITFIVCFSTFLNAQIEINTDSVIAYERRLIDPNGIIVHGDVENGTMPLIWARIGSKYNQHCFKINQRGSILIDEYDIWALYYTIIYHSSHSYIIRFTSDDIVIDVNSRDQTVSYTWPHAGKKIIYK